MVGAKDRKTKKAAAKVATSTDKETLQGFVKKHAALTAMVYTDDARAYEALPYDHAVIKHSLKEHVKGDVHTNGIESLWNGLSQCTSCVETGFSPVVIPVKYSTIET